MSPERILIVVQAVAILGSAVFVLTQGSDGR